ncbi:MAG: GIY-YIG nuclease family protein [Candidatus Doudnabacteria bacterium]|nr:GIY-YIG nuclease family protein [Candidatus Doudnabacteria bacterium]
MTYYLYILYSSAHDRHYIGISKNIDKRLSEHNAGKVFSTRPYQPYELVHQEEYPDKKLALNYSRAFNAAPSSSLV